MERVTAEFIDLIDQERQRRALNHKQFSALLRIDPAYWHRLRTGDRAFNLNTLQLVKQALPALSSNVDKYLSYITGDNHEAMQKGAHNAATSP